MLGGKGASGGGEAMGRVALTFFEGVYWLSWVELLRLDEWIG